MAGPLDGVRVLDLSRNVAGPYATKLLADFGARVIKVEPRGGDPSRRFGPFPGDAPDLEASGLFLHLNTNKESIVLDPHTDDGATTVRRLARQVDVVVEDGAPGEAAAAGWGWDALQALKSAVGALLDYGVRADGAVPQLPRLGADVAGDRGAAARDGGGGSGAAQGGGTFRALSRGGDGGAGDADGAAADGA